MDEIKKEIEKLKTEEKFQKIIDLIEKQEITSVNKAYYYRILGMAYNNLGYYLDLGNDYIYKAIDYLEEALQQKNVDKQLKLDILYTLGYSYWALAENNISMYKKAIEYLNKALEIDIEYNNAISLKQKIKDELLQREVKAYYKLIDVSLEVIEQSENKADIFKPIISKLALSEAEEDWDYIMQFTNKYFSAFDEYGFDKVINKLNNNQMVLITFLHLDSQVTNGGFVQLIYNGYGESVFETDFIKIIKSWGIEGIVNILDEVKQLYLINKEKIVGTPNDSWKEFSEKYTTFSEFEQYDEKYYKINDTDINKLRKYIEDNHKDFGNVL